LAAKILAHRERNLLFSADDMVRIPGIGPRLWQRLAPYFTFSAAADEPEAR